MKLNPQAVKMVARAYKLPSLATVEEIEREQRRAAHVMRLPTRFRQERELAAGIVLAHRLARARRSAHARRMARELDSASRTG